MRQLYVQTRFGITGDHTSRDWTVFRRGSADHRIGIYMIGSCDLPSVFAAKPLIARRLNGTCAILRDGGVFDARSDLLLQTLDAQHEHVLLEAKRRLHLSPNAFEPRLFRSTFRIPDLPSLGEIPKTVAVLSIGADLSRTLYRHRDHGYLIDPGGFWLKQQGISKIMADPKKVEWVRSNFTSVGTLDVDQFRALFARILGLLVEQGTHVVVYNTAVVDPGDSTYSYQFRRNPYAMRRMEFNDALSDLAATYGVSVLNVDRILKREGINDQVDFSHFPLARMLPVAAEFNRILADREVI